MKKIIIIFAFLLLTKYQFAQLSFPQFYDYNTILSDLKTNGKQSIYFFRLNYSAMLYLDKNCINDLLKLNPDFIREERLDTSLFSIKIPERFIHRISVNLKNIEDLFTDETIFRYINDSINDFNNIGSYQLYKNVYIKGDNKAIYELYGGSWIDTYRAILNKNEIIIELLSSVIE